MFSAFDPRLMESLGEGKLQKTVRMLKERDGRNEQQNPRVLEGNSDGEEKETSSSDGGYEKDWRWDNGGWWFRALLTKGKQSECAIQAERFQDGKTDAESGRKERR